jgi:hypothetical protein
MADQPVTRILGLVTCGPPQDMVALQLRCGCVIRTNIPTFEPVRRSRKLGGTYPCPAAHEVPDEPQAARCHECDARLGEGEFHDCRNRDGCFGWVGDVPCSHLKDTLQQHQPSYGNHPWNRTPGWYCMMCCHPPR